MAEAQDVDSLKRRGRRRLVGAVALVLLAVIVLPMVFDPEPRRGAPPVSVRIPGEDDSAFAPKMAKAPEAKPAAPEKKAEEKKVEEKKAEEKKAEDKKAEEQKPAPPAAVEKKADTKVAEAERARAEAALGTKTAYVIPVGAFANAQPVTARLKEARVPYYTEAVATAKGTVTRVRAGPFTSKEAADKALERLKGLGFKPGNVAAQPG